MKRMSMLPFIFSAALLGISAVGCAQTTAQPTMAASRAEVRMDRDEFLKNHRYDENDRNWMPNTPTPGMDSRAEVKMARDEYLKTHRWDESNDRFVVIAGGPRDMSAMSREEVKMETMQFTRTHTWDRVGSMYVEKPSRAK